MIYETMILNSMSKKNPYRAAGTFAGPSYVVREADRSIMRAIRQNQRYPYLLSPRQSGKSSLVVRTIGELKHTSIKTSFIDLSVFSPEILINYDRFVNKILSDIAHGLQVDYSKKEEVDFSLELTQIASLGAERLIVFIDEVDVLTKPGYRDEFFSLIRAMFNQRAWEPQLERIQFVLSGAAPPSQLIKDPSRSPFNVGQKIRLDDLSRDEVALMIKHMHDFPIEIDSNLADSIYYFTSGSVFLTQSILERLWEMANEGFCKKFDSMIVSSVVEDFVSNSNDEIHFRKIYETITNNQSVLDAFCELGRGRQIDNESFEALNITGILGNKRDLIFRNEIYRRIFSPDGPLALVEVRNSDSAPPVTEVPPALFEAPRAQMERPSQGSIAGATARTVLLPARFRPEEPSQIFVNTSRTLVGKRETHPSPTVNVPEAIPPLLQLPPDATTLPSLRAANAAAIEFPEIPEVAPRRTHVGVGDKIGKYRIVRLLGAGGMAHVFVAEQIEIGRLVAIKMLLHELSEPLRYRFLTEARVLSRLHYPGVVQVYDYGLTDADHLPYIVMEFLDGISLAAFLRERVAPVSPSLAINLMHQMSLAVNAIHEAGIVHRDIKPENIMLIEDASTIGGLRVKLLDFGIARQDSSGTVTAPGTVMGTPAYMSPEQCIDAASVSGKSDVYSLGVVFFEILAGRHPFKWDSVIDAITKQLWVDFQIPAELPDEARVLLTLMLRKSPEERPSASDVTVMIERMASSEDRPAALLGRRARSGFFSKPRILFVVVSMLVATIIPFLVRLIAQNSLKNWSRLLW